MDERSCIWLAADSGVSFFLAEMMDLDKACVAILVVSWLWRNWSCSRLITCCNWDFSSPTSAVRELTSAWLGLGSGVRTSGLRVKFGNCSEADMSFTPVTDLSKSDLSTIP
jgi:hypothetical protein